MPYRLATAQYANHPIRTCKLGDFLSMGWIVGIEPTASRATIWRANQLRYTHRILARQKGLEPLAYCLEGSCSILLSYWRTTALSLQGLLERVMGIEPTRPAWKAGILPLNYTRVFLT